YRSHLTAPHLSQLSHHTTERSPTTAQQSQRSSEHPIAPPLRTPPFRRRSAGYKHAPMASPPKPQIPPSRSQTELPPSSSAPVAGKAPHPPPAQPPAKARTRRNSPPVATCSQHHASGSDPSWSSTLPHTIICRHSDGLFQTSQLFRRHLVITQQRKQQPFPRVAEKPLHHMANLRPARLLLGHT